MAQRKRLRRSFTQKRGKLIWCNVIALNNAMAIGSNQVAVVVSGAKWASSATGLQSCTLLRIVGWWSAVQDAATDGACFAALYIEDEDTTASPPDNLTIYQNERVLWHDGFQFEGSTVTTHSARIDVKTNKRLMIGDEVRFVAEAQTTACRQSLMLRALVRV